MDYTKINLETYDSISTNWETKRKFYWKPVENFLKNQNKENKFLDLSCGTGRFLQCAKDLGFSKLIGSDFSENQLEIVKQKGFKTIQAELTNLPFQNNEFNTIICIAAYHHLLEREEQLKSLTEMNRVLNKNGKILLSNWMPSQEYTDKETKKGKFEFINKQEVKVTYTENDNVHDRYYYLFEEEELKELCKEASFNIEKSFIEDGNIYLILTKN